MPFPSFQDYFLPFLEMLNDSKEHPINELVDKWADYFNLSPEDRNELVPSGWKNKDIFLEFTGQGLI